MNPGSPTPQAGILNHSRCPTARIHNDLTIETLARRRPQQPTLCENLIINTLIKATNSGKAKNTVTSISHSLKQLSQHAENRLAQKINQPQLKNIPMRNLRHHFATLKYDQTKDILLVKQLLGHKKIETTMFYTQLITFTEEDEYTVKTATNVKEATDLIEHGFQYVTEMGGIKLFKKRK